MKAQNPCGEPQVLGSRPFEQKLPALQRFLHISLHTASNPGQELAAMTTTGLMWTAAPKVAFIQAIRFYS
jgi:hypothetical protein